MSTNEPVGVLKPFNHQNSRLEIDIVCDGGSSWIKVIARNAKALTLISQGRAEYGQKSVIDQANFYFTCAKNHPHMYKPPTIVFHFACGIEKPLANKLKNLGVIIEGKEIDAQGDDSGEITDNEMSLSESETTSRDSITNSNVCNLLNLNTHIQISDIKILNLDVSTLLGYVTNMTNGRVNYKYLETLLTRQAECERCRPLKHILDSLFQDKKLLVCQTAYDNFKSIVNLIGGPNEKNRTDELISRVTIVNDVPQGRVMQLCLGGKIKMRSRLIFASGENNKCITVSANEGFVRAARMQGVECVVFIHEPRSLSELKELNAERIES
ncbi:UPF0415 protein C7orf25 homolog isoform X2 [Copidosoma floridanum]|nr:UPF0415 protein C7orf25 homolog isoform X2 [Copidosoma floridanum]